MGTYIATVSPLDADLIDRVKARDEGAFQELFTRFRSRIYKTALKILKEDGSAKDASQETFLHIYKGIRSFRGDSKLATWINRITINVCLEMMRRNRKHQNLVGEDISEKPYLSDPNCSTPYQTLSRRETQTRVRDALARLSDKHRLVVELHDLKGHTIREVASMLRVAEGTVKSRLFYGREGLRKQLAA